MTTAPPNTATSGQYAEYITLENDNPQAKIESHQQQQQQSINHWNHESVQDTGGENNNNSNNNVSHHQTSSTGSSEEGGHHNQTTNSNTERSVITSDVSITTKTPNSYKYPLLRQYYDFGPWIGRNRKAICLRCRLQTSSSQPDRLLKHLNKCSKLSDDEKIVVQDLMNERTANKRKPPSNIKTRNRDDNNDDTTEYYGDDKPITDECGNLIPIPPGGLKKLKREHTDRTSQIDEALTRFIMMCRIPLKAVHSQEFVDLVRVLDPEYRIPSRETITNVLIPGMLNII